MRIAITGGIACGKSLFARSLVSLGAAVLDADEVTHRLEAPGGAAVEGIAELFGRRVVDSSGGIDRAELGRIVFADAAARERLNQLLHPLIRRILLEWAEGETSEIRVVVIPLLYEVGWESDWNFVICVASTYEEQIERLMQTRQMSYQQAVARVEAQIPVAMKIARADLVVHNSADAEALAVEAQKVWRILLERSNEYR